MSTSVLLHGVVLLSCPLNFPLGLSSLIFHWNCLLALSAGVVFWHWPPSWVGSGVVFYRLSPPFECSLGLSLRSCSLKLSCRSCSLELSFRRCSLELSFKGCSLELSPHTTTTIIFFQLKHTVIHPFIVKNIRKKVGVLITQYKSKLL